MIAQYKQVHVFVILWEKSGRGEISLIHLYNLSIQVNTTTYENWNILIQGKISYFYYILILNYDFQKNDVKCKLPQFDFRKDQNWIVMMPRSSRRVDDVQKEFAEDFTVVNDNLLLCKVSYLADKRNSDRIWMLFVLTTRQSN